MKRKGTIKQHFVQRDELDRLGCPLEVSFSNVPTNIFALQDPVVLAMATSTAHLGATPRDADIAAQN